MRFVHVKVTQYVWKRRRFIGLRKWDDLIMYKHHSKLILGMKVHDLVGDDPLRGKWLGYRFENEEQTCSSTLVNPLLWRMERMSRLTRHDIEDVRCWHCVVLDKGVWGGRLAIHVFACVDPYYQSFARHMNSGEPFKRPVVHVIMAGR